MRLERTGDFDLDQRYASLCPNELFNSIKSLKAFSISHLYTRYTPPLYIYLYHDILFRM